jgi:hypothetical protein
MRRITFARIDRIEDGSYGHYADAIREAFPGKSALLTKKNAIWCASQHWCCTGGARVLVGAYGSPAWKKWRAMDNKLEAKLDKKYPLEGVGLSHEHYRLRREARWAALFRFVNRMHAAKQKKA